MNRYAPLFSNIVESSIWEEPYYVRVLFTSLLALQDSDHVVRGTAYGIARRSNMTEKEVIDGLKVLASPDKRRLERQPNDGRRIQRVDSTPDREGGWLILNGEKYQEEMRALNRRMYQAAKQREYRARNKNKLFVGSTVPKTD